MMKYKFITCLVLLFVLPLFGQYDEELRKAYDMVYENPRVAIQVSDEILKKTTKEDDITTALIIKVNGYSSLNDSKNTLKYAFEAYDYTKEAKSPINHVRILGLIGEQFQIYHVNDYSRIFLDRAEALIGENSFPKEKRMMYFANIYAIKGNGYKDDLDCDFAIEYYNKAISTYRKVNNQSAINNLCLVYIEKANCLIDQGHIDRAEVYLNKALQLATENKLKEYVLHAKLSLSKLDYLRQDYHQSILHLDEVLNSIDFLEELPFKHKVYQLLVQNYYALSNTTQYEHFSKLLIETDRGLDLIAKESYQESLSYMLKEQGKEQDKKRIQYLVPIFIVIMILIPFLAIKVFKKKEI